jgi:uncharacterized RDD family membrane protein YckC
MEIDPQSAIFGQRRGAGVIDFILTAILVFSIGWLCSVSKATSMLLVVPLALVGFVYALVAHARFGRTVGKYILRIKVIGVDGATIGWQKSLRRSAVDGVVGLIWAFGLLTAVEQLSDEAFHGQGWSALYNLLLPLFPAYVAVFLNVSGVWPWSEFVTMMLNKQRRAIHDFIGATRVIRMSI